jgi:hypothetical protein
MMGRKERRFVLDYLRTSDAAGAARAAGWGRRKARERGLMLLRMPEVRTAILSARAERAASRGLTLERVLLEYERIALADLGRILGGGAPGAPAARSLLDLPADDAAAVAAVTFDSDGVPSRIELHDKGFAEEALCLYFNIYDRAQWRDESEGARDRLLAMLAAMAEAEPPAAAAAAEGVC